MRSKHCGSEVHILDACRNYLKPVTFSGNRWSGWHNSGLLLWSLEIRPWYSARRLITLSYCISFSVSDLVLMEKYMHSKILTQNDLFILLIDTNTLNNLTNNLHTCQTFTLIFDMSQGLAKTAIYSHPLLTTGTYALEWNAIQNAENIFSSCQQTAKGTSGSSPCVRTVISVSVWTFNYCNLLLQEHQGQLTV